jgi:hypothetical protein
MSKHKLGFMFLELLLVIGIIAFILIQGFKLYSKNPFFDKETKKVIQESGIDTTSYKSTIESTRNKVEDIQNKHLEEIDKLDEKKI